MANNSGLHLLVVAADIHRKALEFSPLCMKFDVGGTFPAGQHRPALQEWSYVHTQAHAASGAQLPVGLQQRPHATDHWSRLDTLAEVASAIKPLGVEAPPI